MLPFYCWDCKSYLKTTRGAERHSDNNPDHLVTKLSQDEFAKLSNPQRVQGIPMSRGLVGELIRPDQKRGLGSPSEPLSEKLRRAHRRRR